MSKRLKELNEKRGAKLKEASALLTTAITEKRELKPEERSKIDGLHTEIETLDQSLTVELRQFALETQRAPDLSRSERSTLETFDLGRALRSAAGLNNEKLDGAELEVCQEGAREARDNGITSFKGVMLPRVFVRRQDRRGIIERRDMTATGTTSVTGDQGGMTVANTPMGLLDALYNDDVLEKLGITTMDGLVGNLTLPRIVRGTAPGHKPENGASDEYNATTAALALTPHRLPSYIDVSQQLLFQSSVNIEAYLRNTIISELRSGMQIGLLHGTGADDQPTGVAATTGITTVYAGGAAAVGTNTAGAAPVWADMVNLKRGVAVLNANRANSNYLFNEALVGKLEMTLRAASTDSMFIIDDRAGGRILSKIPAVTNAVSSTLSKGASSGILSGGFYGNWNDLVRGVWGGMNLQAVTDGTLATTGLIRLVGAVYYDGGVQRPASFSYCKDFLTT